MLSAAEGQLTVTLPPDAINQANGKSGRLPAVGHLAGFGLEADAQMSMIARN